MIFFIKIGFLNKVPHRIYCCKVCGKEYSKKQLIKGLIPIHYDEAKCKLCRPNDKTPIIQKNWKRGKLKIR